MNKLDMSIKRTVRRYKTLSPRDIAVVMYA